MSTYAQLQYQIADELGDRQDLLAPLTDSPLADSPIKLAVESAIRLWEMEPFWFNEVYDSDAFSTVVGQEFYTDSDWSLLSTAPNILSVRILIFANRYPMRVRTWGYLENTSVNPSVRGQPFDYAYFGGKMRLYPIPDGVYPLTFSFNILTPPFSDTEDVWTNEAYDLIRSQAKMILAREVLFDDEIMQRMKLAIYGDPSYPDERGYLGVLKARTTRRARAKIQASYF